MPSRNSTLKHTVSRRRLDSQVWFVPDPPMWAAPTAGKQTLPTAEDHPARIGPQEPTPNGKTRRLNSQWSGTPLTPAVQFGGSSGAASDQGYPTPPPTPRIRRLNTPDIKTVDECRPFCDCCPKTEPVLERRPKMELQCKLECRVVFDPDWPKKMSG